MSNTEKKQPRPKRPSLTDKERDFLAFHQSRPVYIGHKGLLEAFRERFGKEITVSQIDHNRSRARAKRIKELENDESKRFRLGLETGALAGCMPSEMASELIKIIKLGTQGYNKTISTADGPMVVRERDLRVSERAIRNLRDLMKEHKDIFVLDDAPVFTVNVNDHNYENNMKSDTDE